MSIDLLGRHTERPELIRQPFEVGNLLGRSKPLEPVQVHQDSQVVQVVMLREDESFPARSFIPLTIGHEAEDPAWLVLELLAQREPGRQ